MPELMGISHVDLTVSDCERAATWWQDVVGFMLVNRTRGQTFETRTLVHRTGVAVTVMTHDGTPEAGAFDERRIGLDHLAFRVANSDELQNGWRILIRKASRTRESSTLGSDQPSSFAIQTTSSLSSMCTPASTRYPLTRPIPKKQGASCRRLSQQTNEQ
jgi:catechol-2,3-dioxygenase